MHQRTLLLNATYEPLMTIGWQRALVLVYLGKSDVLEEYNRAVQSASLSVRVPSVLRLRERVRRTEPTVRFSRTNIYARDAYRCQYCGRRAPPYELTYDHVVPRCLGGRTDWANIVTCCVPCNRRKGSKRLEDTDMTLLATPRRPRWLPRSSEFADLDPPESWQVYLGIAR